MINKGLDKSLGHVCLAAISDYWRNWSSKFAYWEECTKGNRGGGGGEGRRREMNSSPERGRWNLRGNACKGDDIVVFVPFYKFTVKLLIGLS